MEKEQKIIGTLLPLTALQDATFSGGKAFLHWLHDSGQKGWQLLPLHQTQLENNDSGKHVPSPYKGYGIGFDPQFLPEEFKNKIPEEAEMDNFKKEMEEWLEDYSLFCSLRDIFKTDDWRLWDEQLRKRDENALKEWKEKLHDVIQQYSIEQWQLHQAFLSMKKEAEELGIVLIGDLPYYVTVRSPLVWAHQDAFRLNADGSFHLVSGIPAYEQGHFGRQIWGHPLYDWENNNGIPVIHFWKLRFNYLVKIFHLIRFDHAKAFFHYGVMDKDNEKNDTFITGPGAEVFNECVQYCKQLGLSVFVEDTGGYLEELRQSVQNIGIPGMKIFRYAYNEQKKKIIPDYAAIKNYPQNSVVYSTTHDSETLMGYLNLLTEDERKLLATVSNVQFSTDTKQFARDIINALIHSPADLIIIPIQDWLLTTDRINIPGTEKEFDDPNWRYKLCIQPDKLPTKLF